MEKWLSLVLLSPNPDFVLNEAHFLVEVLP